MAYINNEQVLFSVQLHTSGSGTDDENVLNALAALYDLPNTEQGVLENA